ncbi:DUF2793 domain-containing protein [Ectopseudomonas hydrolytica]|uniref:DUF2793 domain-containing protein n=1 Tax=Ectopseudomonas hydrolytica TaxID=2493633 RepID=UPI00376ED4DA
MTTAKLLLTETSNGQANYLNVNAALGALDQLVHQRVVDKDLSTPPSSPVNGASYIIASSPTGAWSGKAGQIAYWLTAVGAWSFLAPGANDRWSVWVSDESLDYRWNGSAWIVQSNGSAPSVRTISGTTGTIVPSDAGNIVLCTNSSAVTLSIQLESTGAWPAAAAVTIIQQGTGTVTVADGSGITVNVFSGLEKSLRGQYAPASLIRTAADTFTLAGTLGGTPA